jgi:hypothetical protein
VSEETGLRVCDLPFADMIEMTQPKPLTRDPVDRIIDGPATLRKALLVTKDATIPGSESPQQYDTRYHKAKGENRGEAENHRRDGTEAVG